MQGLYLGVSALGYRVLFFLCYYMGVSKDGVLGIPARTHFGPLGYIPRYIPPYIPGNIPTGGPFRQEACTYET